MGILKIAHKILRNLFSRKIWKKNMLDFFFYIRRHFRIRMIVIVIEILKRPTLFF